MPPGQDAQQCGFAGTVGTEEQTPRAGFQGQIEIVENGSSSIVRTLIIGEREIFDLDGVRTIRLNRRKRLRLHLRRVSFAHDVI
mmetsp:Transcript_13846/g.23023  ORF Transcript_13846/g.23023 Transcript_13846/m.23023 type:complete len:84 (-) Transcript_13846:151-402(-)